MIRSYCKHGMTKTKIHEVWKEMKRRCKNNSNPSYKRKKIKVCKEWELSKNFIDWALSNGYKEGLQIDRIDNNKGYYPENCRFVTPKENANNRENTIYLTFKGETKNLNDWSEITGIKRHTLRTRLRRNWSTEDVLTKKVQKRSVK